MCGTGAAPLVKALLETMVRVTMMRGAQSAGLVTYTTSSAGEVQGTGHTPGALPHRGTFPSVHC